MITMTSRADRNTADYQRIERAIRFLDESSPTRPRLEEVARHVGMSPFHFQRLFTRWAGISPKRFSQVLALEYAKERLKDSRNLLDATYDAGLSSGGRLHDLSFAHGRPRRVDQDHRRWRRGSRHLAG